MSIKLISLNIEGSKHLKARILPFLKSENPDVVCLQEVFKSDVPLIEKNLKMIGFFVPIGLMSYEKNDQHPIGGDWGLLILTKVAASDNNYEYYYGNPNQLPTFYPGCDPNIINRAIAAVSFVNQGQSFTIASTHFIWSFAGEVSDLQRKTLKSLYRSLRHFPELVLVGDFNAPRGNRIFSDLATKYKDNIPSEIITTIDNQYHRSKDNIEFVVDGLFSSPEYKVSSVSVVNGLSDHCAIVCQVSRENFIGRVKTSLLLFKKRILFLLERIPRWIFFRIKDYLYK